MNLAEKIYVILDPEVSYNICPGGQGGFGFINKVRNHKEHNKKLADKRDYSKTNFTNIILASKVPERNRKILETKRKRNSIILPNNVGRKHREETKQKLSDINKGSKNSQFGKIWITDEKNSLKIFKDELPLWLSNGYRKGRRKNK